MEIATPAKERRARDDNVESFRAEQRLGCGGDTRNDNILQRVCDLLCEDKINLLDKSLGIHIIHANKRSKDIEEDE